MAAKRYLKTKLAIYLFLLVSVISGTTDFTYTQAAIGDTDNDGTAAISASAGLFDIPVSYSVGYCPHENGTYGLASGDVDNDGLIDVVVANHYEQNMGVFIQDSNGNLKQMERYSAGIGSRSAAVGDINNDGLNDIVIVNYRSNDISVFLQGEDGIIGEPVNYEAGYRPLRVAIGDVSDDDLSDVVVFEQAAGGLSHIHIFKQNNTGLLDPKISYEAGNNGHGLAVGDINNDGLNDIVASASRSLYVFLQESDGGFERIEYPVYDYNPEDDDYDAEIENIAIGDVNNDNLNDIVTCSYDQMSIYYQNREGGLSDPVGYPRCRDAAIGDINNDNLNDIVSVKWGISNGGNIRVFLQQLNSQFHQMEYTFGLNLRNVKINDLNNDGLNDVAVVDDNTNELGVFLQLRPCRIHHVDGDATGNNDGSSWADAYNYLQDALMMASAGDEIRVAEGTYKPDQFVLSKRPNLGRGESFQLKNGVAVKGGYAGFGEPDPNARDIELYETVLSGDLNGDDRPNFNNYFDNSFHVVSATGVDETAILDGLTIRGGNADAYYGDPTFPRDGSGGGLLNEDGASPTIRHCRFLGNKSFNVGGAIYNESRAMPSLVGCVIRGNRSSSGGGMCSNDSRASLRDCTFENNWAAFNGGGIYNRDGSHSEILDCVFIGNQTDGDGGAVYNQRNTSATLVNCAFYGNRTEDRPFSEGGSIHSVGAVLSLVNCVFSGNFSGYRGGALYINAGEATIINCSFSGNESVENGGGMSAYTWAALEITNCIFRHNVADSRMDQPAQLYLGTDNHTIKYCCIEGWAGDLGGVGNFDVDPLFVDADGPDNVTGTSDDNLRLFWGSPCLDSGDNSAVASIETDIAGNPRIVDGTVDIGAYEGPFQGILLSSEFVTIPEAASADTADVNPEVSVPWLPEPIRSSAMPCTPASPWTRGTRSPPAKPGS